MSINTGPDREHVGATDAQRRALEVCGGFESYQALLRKTIIAKADTWTVQELREFDAQLTPEDKVDGLEQGLAGIVHGTCPLPLTSTNIGLLEDPLDFSVLDAIRYLLPELPSPVGREEQSEVDRGMDPRAGKLIAMALEIRHGADAVIQERQGQTQQAMAAASAADSAG